MKTHHWHEKIVITYWGKLLRRPPFQILGDMSPPSPRNRRPWKTFSATCYIGWGGYTVCSLYIRLINSAITWFHTILYQSEIWWCIIWIITKFSGSTPVRRRSAVNPGDNSYKPRTRIALTSQFIATFLSLTVIQARVASSEVRKPQHTCTYTSSMPSVKRTLRWIGHSRSFKVILIGAGTNLERCVVVMCN